MQRIEGDSALKVAIVGAGPAGFYTAEALASIRPDCEIDIVERLPTPYGLIRSGVAPDHQTTKSIQETFEQTALRPNVRFLGNIEVDRDVSLDELTGAYDAVVLACGAPFDAPLGIPGGTLKGVYGAAQFVGWYNAHPDHANLDPEISSRGAVVIGNGNVALDIARVLSKSARELAASDIADHAMERIVGANIAGVHIVGRRGPADAKFTTVELQELGHLDEAVALAELDQIPDTLDESVPSRERRIKSKNLECFRAFAEVGRQSAKRKIRFEFNAQPLEVLGTDRVEAVRFARTRVENGRLLPTGEEFEISCSMLISAIGYRARPLGGLALSKSGDCIGNEEGRIQQGLYVVGWLKRGPSGKIGTNRNDGEEIAERIRAEVAPAGKPGFSALRQILLKRGSRWTTFDDWKAIERAEISAAVAGAPRKKFADIAKMLEICSVSEPAVAAQ